MMNQKRKILIYGDSNTYGYDPADLHECRYPEEKRWTTILQERLGDSWQVLPEGMNGRKIPDLVYDRGRLLRLIRMLSERVLFAVMLGTNDLLLTMNPDAGEAVRKMQDFLGFLTDSVGAGNVLVIAPPHIGGEAIRDPLYRRYCEESRKMNAGFAELSERFGNWFLDAGTWKISLSYDRVHFSEEGNRAFAEKLARFLTEEFC